MAYLVAKGHTPEKVKPTFAEIRKIKRSETRRKKEQIMIKNYRVQFNKPEH